MKSVDIERFAGSYPGRSRAVAYDGLVFSVATAADASADVAEQTRRSLAALDRNLADAGSDRTRILSATVYLTDIGAKAQMDAVWNDWIGRHDWPQRACVQAALAPDTLVEITLIAARA